MFTSTLDKPSAALLSAPLMCLMSVACELSDKVQVTYGVRGITSRGGGQGICEWFVVCVDQELSTFKEMRRVAVAKASLMAVKAVVAASVQASSLELLVVEERRALSG